MELHQIDSLLGEMSERLPIPEPETDGLAPHELMPDVAIRDPRLLRNLKGLREKRMQRSGEADRGILAPPRLSPGYQGITRSKRGFILQKAALDTLIANSARRPDLDSSPVTPEDLSEVQPVAFRDDVTTRNRRNQQQADRYRGDIADYLGKIKRGRSLRSVDPLQPALSPAAETIRQSTSVDRANRLKSGRRMQ